MIANLDNPNLAILEMAVQALGGLTDSLVFVGGCATGLLVTRIRANQIRATEDVDVIAEAATIAEYHGVESMLVSRGFKHDTSPDAPICRWLGGGITLDLMPSQPGVLSFHNRWYPLAVSTASPMTLPSGRSIKLIAATVFLATKLEAFKGRGNSDFLASHDLEDIVTVVDGRPAVRIASPEMLLIRVVASCEMLPTTVRGTMLPPDRVCGKRLRALLQIRREIPSTTR